MYIITLSLISRFITEIVINKFVFKLYFNLVRSNPVLLIKSWHTRSYGGTYYEIACVFTEGAVVAGGGGGSTREPVQRIVAFCIDLKTR